MALGTIGTIMTIAAGAASLASAGYSAAQGAPTLPNGASASREIAQAQANALPTQRALAAAEQQGGTYDVFDPAHRERMQMVVVPTGQEQHLLDTGGITSATGFDPDLRGIDSMFGGRSNLRVPYVESEWQPGGKYYAYGQKLAAEGKAPHITTNHKGKVPDKTTHYDFKGHSTADIEGELARQLTDQQISLGKKYGTQFAEEARRELELADPEGTAARNREYQMIEDEINNPKPINPLSSMLEGDIDAQLKSGSGLDPMSRDLLDAAVTKANAARSGNTSAGDVAGSMSTGAEGEARRQAGITKAQGFLSSGATPEDIAYRREQQNLQNLGSFVNGRTPESQFQSLAGAGNGSAPFYPGQPSPQLPGNASSVGAQYAGAAGAAKLNAEAGQANPWLAGLSTMLQGIGTFNNMRG